jgi:hypothetical protein
MYLPLDDQQEAQMATSSHAPHFEQNIRPLFRERDRQSMEFAFDLWDCDDVRENAQAILERLAAGTMPCDGDWPKERIALFQRWLDAGTPA